MDDRNRKASGQLAVPAEIDVFSRKRNPLRAVLPIAVYGRPAANGEVLVVQGRARVQAKE